MRVIIKSYLLHFKYYMQLISNLYYILTSLNQVISYFHLLLLLPS